MLTVQLITSSIILLVIAFWAWMLYAMLHNDDIPSVAAPGLRWPPVAKNHWIILFVVLNIFAAGYYYFTVYREQR